MPNKRKKRSKKWRWRVTRQYLEHVWNTLCDSKEPVHWPWYWPNSRKCRCYCHRSNSQDHPLKRTRNFGLWTPIEVCLLASVGERKTKTFWFQTVINNLFEAKLLGTNVFVFIHIYIMDKTYTFPGQFKPRTRTNCFL